MTEIKLDHANRQLQLNTFQEVINGKTIVYFITQKRNNTGTLYNLRFFIIQEPDRISYSTSFDDNIVLPFRKVSNIPTTKATVMVKDILKVETGSDLTMMIMFEPEEGSKVKPYWILKFQSKAILDSVQERVSKLRNRMAMQLRGTGGMLEGPNSVSKFKKSVEVSLVDNKVSNPQQSPQNGYTKWKQFMDSPKKQKEPDTPVPTIKRQIKFVGPETIQKLEKPLPSPEVKPVAVPPPPPVQPTYRWLNPFLNKPYNEASKQFTEHYMKNIKTIASLRHNTWVDHDDALIKIQQGSSDYLSYWENIRYLYKKLKPDSKIRVPLVCFLKYNNLMILVKCKLPTKSIVKPQQAIEAIQKITKCSGISIELEELDNPHSIHRKIWIVHDIEKLLPEDMTVRRTVGFKIMDWLNDPTREEIKEIVSKKVQQATGQLNKAQFANRKQLKSILESFGLSLCHLHLICLNIQSKVARRYVFTMMVAERIGERFFGKGVRENISVVAEELSEEYKVQGKDVILGLVFLCLLDKWGVKGIPEDMDQMEYEVRKMELEIQEQSQLDMDLEELEQRVVKERLPLSLCDQVAPNDSKYKKISKNLYDCQGEVSYRSWKIQHFHIKWLLLQENPQDAVQMATKLQNQIRTWLFGLSPILFDTLILLGRYYSANNDPSAIKHIQNAIECFTQCCEDKEQFINLNNELSSALLKNHRYEQTVEVYERMLRDMKEIGLQNTVANAEMLYSLSKIQLKLGRLMEAKENCLESLNIYYSLNEYEDEIVECYELLSRVAELDDSELLQTIDENCSNGIGELKKTENFQKMLRMVLLPRLIKLQKNQKQAICEIIEDIPRMANGYQKSYTFLRQLVNKSNLIPSINRCFSECEDSTIKKSLPQWRRSIVPDDTKDKFQKHLLLLESFSNFLGLNFILGALQY